MKKQFINDLKAGDSVRSFFVAKHKRLEQFRDKSKGRYLTVFLADRSGRMVARAWENGPALYDKFEDDDVVAVTGRIDDYLGRRQIIIDSVRSARPDERDVRFNEDDFLPQTGEDVDVMWGKLMAAVESVTKPQLKALLQGIVADESLASGLRAAPASKTMHHAYRGGLLEHITEMLALGSCLVGLYPLIDSDLLTAGIIVHDLGLIEGAHYERAIDYTDAGRLVGHVALGQRIVSRRVDAIPDFSADLALRLEHMILSHHGETEHGAVRLPQTLEAVALANLNSLSAGVSHVREALESEWDPDKAWTAYDRIWGRFYFRGHSPTEHEGDEGATPQPADADASAPDVDAATLREPRPAYPPS